jgi:hypothetical protein
MRIHLRAVVIHCNLLRSLHITVSTTTLKQDLPCRWKVPELEAVFPPKHEHTVECCEDRHVGWPEFFNGGYNFAVNGGGMVNNDALSGIAERGLLCVNYDRGCRRLWT